MHVNTAPSNGKLNRACTFVIQRPLSCLSIVLAGSVITGAFFVLVSGNLYLSQLNWIDITTPAMIGVLVLRGIVSLRRSTDLQAVSIALTVALSFIFAYEAIYKLSFYGYPWRMPPPELREFVIQIGISLTALVGFAFGGLRVSRLSIVLSGLFVVLYGFWLLVGFPQLANGQDVYPALIHIPLTWNAIYATNRGTKLVLMLLYYSFYGGNP